MERRLTKLRPGQIAPPHLLKIGDFLKSHSYELNSLLSLSGPVSVIPNHLRRRLKSFRPFKCVHSKRERIRRKRVNEGHDDRGDLATHVWHAKRFKMGQLWGKRIPLTVNDKSHRSVYKRFSISAVVHDMSYWDCYSFDSMCLMTEEIMKIGIEPPFCIRSPSEAFLNGNCRIIDMLKDFNGSIISPIYLQKTSSNFLLFVHPCHRPISLAPFLEKSIKWFELRGPESLKYVSKAMDLEISSQPCVGKTISIKPGIFLTYTSQGCDLILTTESANVRETWKFLVFAGASPIGAIDRAMLLREFQVPVFPFDFFDSKAGRDWEKLMIGRHVREQALRPFSKQIPVPSKLPELSVNWLSITSASLVPRRFITNSVTKPGNSIYDINNCLIGYTVFSQYSLRLGKAAGLAVIFTEHSEMP